jgi:hypothetical protein
MKNKKYHSVRQIPKSNPIITEKEENSILKHKHMTAHFSGLIQALP